MTRRSMLISSVAPGALLAASLLLVGIAGTATGQQFGGVPGSPSATATIDGAQLRSPPQKFQGTINREADKSKSIHSS